MMAKSNGQCVGGVVLIGCVFYLEDRLQHTGHLLLRSIAVSGDGLLYFFRGIFGYRQSVFECGRHGHPLGATQFEHALNVLSEEGCFDGEFGGFVLADESADRGMNDLQSFDAVFCLAGFEYAQIDETRLLSAHPNDRIPHHHGTGVDPQNDLIG